MKLSASLWSKRTTAPAGGPSKPSASKHFISACTTCSTGIGRSDQYAGTTTSGVVHVPAKMMTKVRPIGEARRRSGRWVVAPWQTSPLAAALNVIHLQVFELHQDECAQRSCYYSLIRRSASAGSRSSVSHFTCAEDKALNQRRRSKRRSKQRRLRGAELQTSTALI